VNFVVEQTGYPPEIVELDADLEADLGIDSIKKAQLFGELGEYFEVRHSEDLTLDDFPTLRHVLEYLTANLQTTVRDAGSARQPVGVVESLPTPNVPPAPRPQPAVPSSMAPAESPNVDQLAQFLVNFVVEQTGYPPEIVELDADLEADLGIDSIKKAQLFGELGEYFEVRHSEDLTLDDFPTLRHVLEYLTANLQTKNVDPERAKPDHGSDQDVDGLIGLGHGAAARTRME
jgi:acyl carrier protein